MPDPKNPTQQDQPTAKPTRLKPSGMTTLRYQEVPSPPAEDKQIHRRRPLPLIPEGEKENETSEDRPGDKDETE
jgi:hypothetical protein